MKMLVESDESLKGGLTTVKYHGVDISTKESVEDFKGFLEREHPEGIDVVVNNAGIAMNGFGIVPNLSLTALPCPALLPSLLTQFQIFSRLTIDDCTCMQILMS